MVAEQLVPHGVTDERVLEAMAEIPREAFLSPRLRRHAYEDRALAIECGQTISQPLVVALMTQALAPKPDDIALEVGTGSGYQAAVLSRLCRKVITLEREPALAEHASETLARMGFANVEVAAADGSLGWPDSAPYDMILVACAAPGVPPALIDQLAENFYFVGEGEALGLGLGLDVVVATAVVPVNCCSSARILPTCAISLAKVARSPALSAA